MPCDSLITNEVSLAKSNADLMELALAAMGEQVTRAGSLLRFGRGYNESIDCATGASRLRQGRDVNEIKRAYSAQVVLSTAKRYGWTVKKTGQFNYEVVKR